MAKKAKVTGERKATVAEAERIEKGRRLAASYLVQRDGMDAEVAAVVVAGMEADEVNALIEEANTAVIEAAKADPDPEPESAVPDAIPEFTDYPALAADDEFVALTLEAQEKSALKRQSEIDYKEAKTKLWAKMIAAGVELDTTIMCAGVPLTPYQGKAVTLDKTMLLEKGVSLAIINKCYRRTPYNDVRLGKVEG